jgi:hypothetical protein
MAINFNNPVTSEDRAAVLADVRDHVRALAKMLDGETTSNLPVGAIRYSSGNTRFEKWNGSAWDELALSFLKSSGGNLSGGLNGTSGAFTSLTVGGAGVWHSGNFDPNTKLNIGATAVRALAVGTTDPGAGQGGIWATATDLVFRDGSANRTVWHNNNFNPASYQLASTAWNSGNFNPATKQDVLGFTPINKAGDSSIGGLTMSSCTVSGAVTTSEWFRTNGAQGWYNNTYGIGIYAIDSTYVRTYNGSWMMANGFQVASQRALKRKIKKVAKGALDRVMGWKIHDYEYKKRPGVLQIGLIADEADPRIGDAEGINTTAALFELAAAFQEYVKAHP